MCYLIFKFLKRDCGTIPVAEITSGKIEFFSKHQRFLIATDSSKYLLIFVLYRCVILLTKVNNEQPSPSNERFSLILLVNVDRRFSIFIATVEK
jgi:hypothetical protein